LRRHAVALPKITVADAVTMIKADAKADGKSDARQKQLGNVLDLFAKEMNAEVHTLEPNIISKYLTALPLSERSKRNHRDVLGFFFRWPWPTWAKSPATRCLENPPWPPCRPASCSGLPNKS
jgi:hypothetical protein